jgi:hypothetical protein
LIDLVGRVGGRRRCCACTKETYSIAVTVLEQGKNSKRVLWFANSLLLYRVPALETVAKAIVSGAARIRTKSDEAATLCRSPLNNRSSLLPSFDYFTTSSMLFDLPFLLSMSRGFPSYIRHDSQYLLRGSEKLSLAQETEVHRSSSCRVATLCGDVSQANIMVHPARR